MESPPDLETVYQAVYSLYNNSNPSGPGKTSQWLDELQKSVFAWKIADEMLQQKRDVQSCYFAAQTMRTKIQLCFQELPAEAHISLRDSLMNHISQINEHTNSAIVTQLCLALADLALQMSSWQKPVVDLINRFGGSTASLWPLLEVMTVLPEEVNSRSLRLGANRRQHILLELNASADTVTEFLKMCLKNGGENVQIRVTILRCFTSWIAVHAIPLVPTSDVIIYTLQILGNHMTGSQLHEAAADCICVILQVLEEDSNSNRDNNSESNIQLQQLQLFLFTSVMSLEQAYHLSVAHEDMDKSINYCRIFTELAETFLETMANGCVGGKQHYAIKILDLVLVCVGHHDYEVAQITFNLWYRLSDIILYQKNSEDLYAVFRPHIERLIGALCRHCQMEPDHLGLVEEGAGGEEFADFRNRVSDLIKDVVFVVGSSHCFRQMFSSLTGGPGPQGQPNHVPTWDSTEAALFVMQAVAKNILPKENDVVPKVVEAILNLPENTHIAVRHTSILLLGELCEWIESHPQSLEPVLNFLLTCLSQKGLGSAACGALLSICTACPSHMASHFPGLLQIARSLDSFAISNEAAIGLLKGVAIIMSSLGREELTQAMKELCWFQARPLCEIMERRIPIEVGTKTDPVVWLDRLAAIFRHTDLDPPVEDRFEPHPCQNAVTEMWPVLSNVCTTYQNDAKVMERCCRCLRFAVRCVGKHSAHLLEPLVKQIVQLYAAHQHSCFLYLGSILVDEYAIDSECVPGLLKMLEAFIGPTFNILQQQDGLKNHPDTVDDLFRLCARFLQRAPIPFLCSVVIESIIDCALMACSLDHRDANVSVMKFFYDLLHCGRNNENRTDYTIRRELVQRILKEKGQTLVIRLLHASVFSLSSYMLSDVADVFNELSVTNRQLLSKWLEEAIKTMPSQNAGGSPTAQPEQLFEFHNTVVRAETPKSINHALRNFARLYR
ncbi:transportin-3 [Bombus pascuorum]|uniref:transportin-3 n=1 Tax=Bombus pascuorum TaxID=65598 RepID=UPI0021232E09|nr:transportin-3 [Bombus pascuorum]